MRSILLLALLAIPFLPAAEADGPPCVYGSDDACLYSCLYGYTRDCVVYNPCDPRRCRLTDLP